jgi:hypothetical protein
VQQCAREEQWGKLGVDVVKHDLMNGGTRFVGGPLENREAASAWVRRKENKSGALCTSIQRSPTGLKLGIEYPEGTRVTLFRGVSHLQNDRGELK